ncbi:MAG: NAD-binding protein, partial [Ignavibacteria bacterium]|nr:NAD-binding protein [Ignavibacteria bacterium]
GQATGEALAQRKIEHVYVERSTSRAPKDGDVIIGNALDAGILKEAGIQDSPAVIVTTHTDDANIFLTTYCRRLRPDIQISSRATLETNVRTLHRAGADFVISFASMGANAVFNYLKRGNILMVSEGLDVFKVPVPPSLRGKTLQDTGVRPKTGCHIIAWNLNGHMEINPGPEEVVPEEGEMVLIGTADGEDRFLKQYVAG